VPGLHKGLDVGGWGRGGGKGGEGSALLHILGRTTAYYFFPIENLKHNEE